MSSALRSTIATIATFISFHANAGQQIYTCSALERRELTASGILEKNNLPSQELIGTFIVARDTGLAQGYAFGISGFKQSETRVLARGNEKNSFVAVYGFARPYDGAAIATFIVEEFRSQKAKPFLLLSSETVITGMCE